MRTIEISTEVFAAIWSLRDDGEESEDAILRRVLPKRRRAMPIAYPGVLPSPRRRMRYEVRWIDDVTEALRSLGGKANLRAIYDKVFEVRQASGRSLPPNLEAVVRKELEVHCAASEVFDMNNIDLFVMPEGKGAGVWALRKP